MKSFCVTDHGAVPYSEDVQSEAFQRAIDACFLSGGGEVTVPEGCYVIGDIRLRSNVTLHLLRNAVLLGSTDPADYQNIFSDRLQPLPEEQVTYAAWCKPSEWVARGGGFKKFLYTAGSAWNYGMIRAVYAENVAIVGEEGSLIDGRNVFDPNGEEKYRGPHGINMHFCKNVSFRGYTVTRAGNWSHLVFHSERVAFSDLQVLAGHDALHVRACRDVVIERCKLITGDDSIAGCNNVGVVVRNCEISSACSAFRFGGADILIEDCRAYGPCRYQFRGRFTAEEKAARADESAVARRNMICFYTNFVTTDLPVEKRAGNIVIRNCTVSGGDRLLHVNLSGNENWQKGEPPTDITLQNVRADNMKTGLYAYGKEGSPFEISLENVSFGFREGSENEPLLKAAFFDKIRLTEVSVENFGAPSLVLCWSDGGNVEVAGLKPEISSERLRGRAEVPFVCDRI